MKAIRHLAAALLGVAALAPIAAHALTLDEAIDRALARNEVAGIAQARIEQARAQRRIAIARLLPSVTAQGTWTIRPEITRNIAGSEQVVQPSNALGAQITASTQILDPAAIPLVTAASRDARAQELASEDLLRNLAFEVARSYVQVLAAEAVADAAERRVQVAGEALAVARERLEAGLTNRNDVTRTELTLSDARLAFTNAREAARLTRIALAYLLAEGVEGELSPPVLAMPPSEPEATALAEQARTRRPDLRALELQTSAADARDDEPMLRLLPTLDAQAAWRATNQAGFTGAESDWNVVLALTWEIYDGGRRYGEAALFEARTRELRLQTASLGRQVDREVAEALVGLQTARVAAEEAALRARVAQQNEEEVVLRFEAGLATALEQADAITQRFEAEAEAAREAFQLEVELLALRSALGLWPLERSQDGVGTQEERG